MPTYALDIETAPARLARSRLLWGCATLLFGVNVYVAHRLFTLEYSAHLESNEGTFLTISRMMAAHPLDLRWFPFWEGGIPFQNTYLPLLHVIVAIFSRVTGRSAALGFHAVSGFFYCLGPVALFFMAATMSRRIGYSFVGSLLYSLTSPASMLIPAVRVDAGGVWNARRLQILGFYGEGPHITTVALLPFAILLLYLSLKHRRPQYYVLTGLLMAGVVLSNAFGAVDLVIMTLCLLATIGFERLGRNVFTVSAIGACTYLFISPCLPPSLLRTIRINSRNIGGDYTFSSRTALGFFLLGAGFLLLWWITRRWRLAEHLRFFLLCAFLLSGIPVLSYAFDLYVFPQPYRYQVEMEMALCLAVPFTAALVLDGRPRSLRMILLAALLLFSIRQTIYCVRYARGLIRPIDITTTIAYKTAMWMKEHYQTERVLLPGGASYLFNVFTDLPQMQGGHEPNVPNWTLRVAIFSIYSGMNAGARDAEISVLWMKAFGVQAVMIPGPTSIEYERAFANPRKFDGVLPVLWELEGTKIYRVPNRTTSLAHVVPVEALVSRQPIHGLDVQQVSSYVAALDNASFPAAEIQWHDLHSFRVSTRRRAGQAISIQMTYHPGWHALESGADDRMSGKEAVVAPDGIGQMAIRPECEGECSIEMWYDGGWELRLARLLSAMVGLGTIGYLAVGLRRRLA